MVKYNVVITKSVQKTLLKLPDDIAGQLEDAMLKLESNPRPNGYTKLKGREGFRIRVGSYRILYTIKDQLLLVTVVDAGHRKDIYE